MTNETPSLTTYNVADLRKNLGEALNQAHYKDAIVRVTSHEKPNAAIVSTKAADFLDFIDGTSLDDSHAKNYVANKSPEQLETMTMRLKRVQRLVLDAQQSLPFTDSLGPRNGRTRSD